MRQLFSSARIENVEAVARLLEDAGIEVRITNGRSYRGAIRGNFSYREGASNAPRPAVWVIRSDQQPEARRMLREAGLLQKTTQRNENFLPPPALVSGGTPLAARGGGRFRYGLLLGVAVMVALVMIAYRASRGDGDADTGQVPATAPATSMPATAAVDTPVQRPGAPGMPLITTLPDEAFVVATPPALAAALLRAELAAAGTRRGCLAIDGADPDPGLLRELAAEGLDVTPASACTDGRPVVAVKDYATDGSGSGQVQLTVGDGEPQARDVRREGRDWLLPDPR